MYAASEGLSTLVVEREAIGGQAGTSSLIRNYPGFARGISGNHLAFRSFHQAWMFGAVFHFFRSATGLEVDDDEQRVLLSDGTTARTRTTIVATGVDYRRLDLPEVEELIGRGVFYGAAVTEARSMTGFPVHVIGGGNSAGQAALHLAKYAAHVTLLVRGADVAASMSEYLVAQLRATRNVDIRHQVEVTGARSVDGRLTEVEITRTRGRSGRVGAVPGALRAHRLLAPHDVARGGRRAGRARASCSSARTRRPSPGRPTAGCRQPLETTASGVFAIGDTRRGSVKRVATAVGDGAAVVAAVHAHLAPRMVR